MIKRRFIKMCVSSSWASHHPAVSARGESCPGQDERAQRLPVCMGADPRFWLAWGKSGRKTPKGNEFSGGRMRFQCDRGTVSYCE